MAKNIGFDEFSLRPMQVVFFGCRHLGWGDAYWLSFINVMHCSLSVSVVSCAFAGNLLHTPDPSARSDINLPAWRCQSKKTDKNDVASSIIFSVKSELQSWAISAVFEFVRIICSLCLISILIYSLWCIVIVLLCRLPIDVAMNEWMNEWMNIVLV